MQLHDSKEFRVLNRSRRKALKFRAASTRVSLYSIPRFCFKPNVVWWSRRQPLKPSIFNHAMTAVWVDSMITDAGSTASLCRCSVEKTWCETPSAVLDACSSCSVSSSLFNNDTESALTFTFFFFCLLFTWQCFWGLSTCLCGQTSSMCRFCANIMFGLV